MSTLTANQVLDVKGLNCPMPLVKARQTVMKMDVGHVLKVIATDRGSINDFQGWAKTAKNIQLVDQAEEQANGQTVYVHYVKRSQ